MEREGLDRRLVHVFVAAIYVEITAAEAGKLEWLWCYEGTKGNKTSQRETFILTIASSGWWMLFLKEENQKKECKK